MFKVIRRFKDKDGTIYEEGSFYNKPLSKSRQEVLTTKNNKYKKAFIKELNFPHHIGGGWYELSNGEKVQGKTNSEAAEANLE